MENDIEKVSIIDIIKDAVVRFENETGKKPRNVYLGEYEVAQFIPWAQSHLDLTASESKNIALPNFPHFDLRLSYRNRPSIDGLDVYYVNAITHLACS